MTTHGLSAGRYLYGAAALLVVLASLGFASAVVRRRLLPSLTRSVARLAEVVIGLALLTAELELLGAVGLFRLGPIVLGAAVIGLAGWRFRDRSSADAARVLERVRRRSILDVVALVAVAAVTAEWMGPTLDSYAHGIRTFDTLWYHLPWAASYAQTGNVASLRFTDIEYLTAFYPAGAELLHGAGFVLMGGDVLSPLLNLGFLGLALLAAWCIGRPSGVAPLTALAGALGLAAPTLLLSQAGSAANDIVGLAFLLAAVALVVNGVEAPAVLALAAVAAGLAVGVKLSLLAPVAALSAGVLVWRRGRRTAVWWITPLVLTGGYWYLRNLIAVGNPLPWVSLPGLATPAAPLQAGTGFSIAHYLGDPSAWRGVLEPGLASDLGAWWWATLVLVAAGALLATALPRRDPRVRLVGGVALASLLAYVLTPESAAGPSGHPIGFAFNLRYSAPALALSLIAVALLPASRLQNVSPPETKRRRNVPTAVAALLLLLLIVSLANGRWWHHVPGQLIAAAVVLAAAALTLAGRPGRRALAGGAASAALLAVALGFPAQRDYFRHRYTYSRGVSALSPVWAMFRTIHHARVGIVGTYGGFFAYPLYGIDGSNRVEYLAARGAHGSFTPIRTCRAWRAAVDAEHLDLLVTTPSRDPWHPHRLHPSPEGDWTRPDPAARVIYRRNATGQPITVFAISGRLDPAACG